MRISVEFANCTVAETHFLGLDCNMAALEHHWVWQELTLSCKPAEFKELQTRVPEALGTHPREYSHLDAWEGLHTKQDSSNGNTKLAPRAKIIIHRLNFPLKLRCTPVQLGEEGTLPPLSTLPTAISDLVQ